MSSLEKCLGQYLPQATLHFVMCQVQGSGKKAREHRCAASDKGLSQSLLLLESSDCFLSDSSLFLLLKHFEERFSVEGEFRCSSMSSIIHRRISLENSLMIHLCMETQSFYLHIHLTFTLVYHVYGKPNILSPVFTCDTLMCGKPNLLSSS